MARRTRIDAFTFVRAWQESNSVAEVANKTGMREATIRTRAYNLRKQRGIPLKEYKRGPREPIVDWDQLKVYAEVLNKQT